MRLAELCSQAVDYAKNGIPVDLHKSNVPKQLIKFKPDWHKAEVTGAQDLDYYESDRALGHLFRNIELYDPKELIEGLSSECPAPLEDPITRAVAPHIRSTLGLTQDEAAGAEQSSVDDGYAEQLHAHYMREMRYICVTHTLVDAQGVCLTEEEVVLGTIAANCTQPRWRSSRSERMRQHAGALVDDIYAQIVQCEQEGEDEDEDEDESGKMTDEQLRVALPRAWSAWCWAQYHRDREYVESFALLVLRAVFNCLKELGGLPETETTSSEM
jgi:RNA-dependent RNA polymerase